MRLDKPSTQIKILILIFFLLDLGLWSSITSGLEKDTIKTFFESGMYDEAIKFGTNNIDRLSDDDLLFLGKSYLARENSLAAVKTFSLALSKKEKNFEAKTLIAAEYIKQNKDKEALAALKEALEWNSKYEPAYFEIEKIYLKRSNKYEIRTLYSDMLDKIGEKPYYLVKLCEYSYLTAFFENAIKFCRRSIVIDKLNPNSFIFLSYTYRDTGKVAEAVKLLRMTAEKFTESLDPQLAYAGFMDDQKNYLEANRFYRKAVGINRKSQKAWLGLAASNVEIQKYKDGLDAFTESCKLGKSAVVPVRKYINVLKSLKATEWIPKYDSLSDKCTEMALTKTTEKTN